MADETPTLRDQDLWSGTFSGAETPTLRLGARGDYGAQGDPQEHWAHLLLNGVWAGDVRGATADCITALAAALDPRTTEVLFEQRDTAIAERDRLRQTLAAVDAERVQQAIEVRRLEALTRIVDITTLGDADRQLRCNTCGHVRTEPREVAK